LPIGSNGNEWRQQLPPFKVFDLTIPAMRCCIATNVRGFKMDDSAILIAGAHILATGAISAATSVLAFMVNSRLDDSARSAGDKLLDQFALVMFPYCMAVIAMIGVCFALDAGTPIAFVCAYAFAFLVGPVAVAAIVAVYNLGMVICGLVEKMTTTTRRAS
jgi:hypothetical protein